MSFSIRRTNQEDPAFRALVQKLDAELAIRDGDEHTFYNQFNGIGNLAHVVVAYLDDIPVACGAFKIISTTQVELKRMFVLEEERKKGHAKKVLCELERWALSLNYKRIILETGKVLFEAMSFYPKQGYCRIPNFSPYIGIENSVCFEKTLKNNPASAGF